MKRGEATQHDDRIQDIDTEPSFLRQHPVSPAEARDSRIGEQRRRHRQQRRHRELSDRGERHRGGANHEVEFGLVELLGMLGIG